MEKIVPDKENIKFTSGTKFLLREKRDNTIFIHSGSGLAFNALLQNKIVISYQPIQSKWNNTLPNMNSIIMKSDEEIIKYIKRKKYNQFKINQKKINYLRKVISNSKNHDACYKIASHWEKFKSKDLSKKTDYQKY